MINFETGKCYFLYFTNEEMKTQRIYNIRPRSQNQQTVELGLSAGPPIITLALFSLNEVVNHNRNGRLPRDYMIYRAIGKCNLRTMFKI